jgi:hypothetical protein
MPTDEINRSGTPSSNSGDGVLVRHWGDGSAGLVRGVRMQGYYPSGPDWRDVQVDVDGKLVVSGGSGGSGDTELPAAVALADNTANPTVPGVGAFAMVWDGATWDRATQPLTDAQLRATPVPVSGTVELGATTLSALESITVVDGGGSITVDGTVSVTEPVSVDDNGGSLTVDGTVELGATTLSALESITVVDGGSSLTVDGTVSVSGSVDTELPAAAALADNTANPTVPGVGAFAMVWDGANWDRATQPLTDTQLRASAVPVSNSVLSVVGGGTEATAQRVTIASDSTGVLSVDDNGSTLSVDDGAGSLTVDNPALSVVGGGAEATAQRVTIASDSTGVLSVDDNGGSLTVDGSVTALDEDSSTGTHANVTGTGSSVALIASNANRKGATIYNDSGVTAYVKLGTGASSTSFAVKMVDQSYYEVPFKYTGVIEGLWASGSIRVVELT